MNPKIIFFLRFCCLCVGYLFFSFNDNVNLTSNDSSKLCLNEVKSIYEEMKLDCRGVDFKVFELAFQGHELLETEGLLAKPSLLTFIDYELPSTEKRLWILDLDKGKVLKHLLVSHGKNSGLNYPRKFSNILGSLQSSLGFFVTSNSYMGDNGYSMRLDGLEKGWNSKARARAIVMHGAEYVDDFFVKHYKRLGRSWGCPAVDVVQAKPVINLLKNGSCLFIYGPDSNYIKQSPILERSNDLSL